MNYLYRKIEEKILEYINRKEYFIIRGPRQAGKTTLLLHLKEKLNNSEYITLEDIDIRYNFEKYPKEFIERYIDKKIRYLFIDEAQYIKNIGEIIKLIYDLYSDKIKLIISGSGSFDIKEPIGKYMVGRAFYFTLYQLSFEEFLLWKASDLHKYFKEYYNSFLNLIINDNNQKDIISPVFEKDFLELLKEFIIFGSYPEVVKSDNYTEKKFILKNITSMYIEKDVGYFFGIRNIKKFEDLLIYLSGNIGNILEYSSTTNDLNINHLTLQNYLEILQQTFIINLLKPFHRNTSSAIKKSRKIYFIDLGLRNTLLNNFQDFETRIDKGQLLENYIFLELLKNFENWNIYYYRTKSKAEVDFILEKDNKIIPIEVKINPEITRSLITFLNKYNLNFGIVFNLYKFDIKEKNGKKIYFLPAYYI